MQRLGAAAASVAVVTTDQTLSKRIIAMLTDDVTTVRTYAAIAALYAALGSTMPDVVAIDDDEDSDAALEMRQLRRRQPALHILYLNVGTEQRAIDLLNLGADDAVLLKSPQLPARMHSAKRRVRTLNAQNRIAIGDIVFDREWRRVWCAGREVEVTPLEFAIIDCLFWHSPNPVGIDTLANFVWGEVVEKSKSHVQVYISYVRKKLASSESITIGHTNGAGYAFTPRNRPDQ